MTFLEAVQALISQHLVRRPWKHNSDKHLLIRDGVLKFSHQHPYSEHYRESAWIPYAVDILATDWEIYDDGT